MVPSTIVQIGLGTLMIESDLSLATFLAFFGFLVLPAAAGVTLGSIPTFIFAKYGFDILSQHSLILKKYHDSARDWVKKHEHRSEVAFFVMRALPTFSSLVAALSGGLFGFSIFTYLTISFFGSIIRITVLGFIGWQVSSVAQFFTGAIGWIALAISIILIVAILKWFGSNSKSVS